jgi:hypothetical protein
LPGPAYSFPGSTSTFPSRHILPGAGTRLPRASIGGSRLAYLCPGRHIWGRGRRRHFPGRHIWFLARTRAGGPAYSDSGLPRPELMISGPDYSQSDAAQGVLARVGWLFLNLASSSRPHSACSSRPAQDPPWAGSPGRPGSPLGPGWACCPGTVACSRPASWAGPRQANPASLLCWVALRCVPAGPRRAGHAGLVQHSPGPQQGKFARILLRKIILSGTKSNPVMSASIPINLA